MLLRAQDQVLFLEAGDGLADGAGAEAGVFHDLGDGVWEGFLVPSAAPGLVPAKDQQDFEFGAARGILRLPGLGAARTVGSALEGTIILSDILWERIK